MFNAIKQAFKGQAGLPATLLAYLFVFLTALAAYFGIPRVESSAIERTKVVLQEQGYPQSLVDSVTASGRNISVAPLEGEEAQNKQLISTIDSIDGVRWGSLNTDVQAVTSKLGLAGGAIAGGAAAIRNSLSSDEGEPSQAEVNRPTTSDAVEVKTEEVSADHDQPTTTEPVEITDTKVDAASTEAEVEIAASTPATEANEATENVVADQATETEEPPAQEAGQSMPVVETGAASAAYQPAADAPASMLTAYFEKGNLKVTGVVPEKDDVNSLTRALSQIRRSGLTTIEIRSGSANSDLHWQNDFLGAISSIPNDAVGKIVASDQDGIQIVPDNAPAEPTTIAATEASSSADPAPVMAQNVANPETSVQTPAAIPAVVPAPSSPDTSTDLVANGQTEVAAEPAADVEVSTETPPAAEPATSSIPAVEATTTAESNQHSNTKARTQGGFSMGMNADSSTNISAQQQMDESRHITRSPGPDINVEKRSLAAVAEDGAVEGGATANGSVVTQQQGGSPLDYIVNLNYFLTGKQLFESGETTPSPELESKLAELVQFLNAYPNTLIRIVGNVDFTVGQRDGEYVGVRRARAVRDYLRNRGIDSFRIFAAPLPRGYAFDEQTQIVFYISE